MRRWHEEKQDKVRIEIIPMIDVMMFLLVFFVLLSLNVIPAAGIKANLPTSANPDKVTEAKVLVVGFLSDGSFQFENQSLSESELVKLLTEKSTTNASASVLLVGDADIPLQKLIHAMDNVKSSGIKSVSVAAKPN